MNETTFAQAQIDDLELGTLDNAYDPEFQDKLDREYESARIRYELDQMHRAEMYQRIEQNLISATDTLPELVPIVKRKGVLICSEGNISAVVGEAKSKKTFLCTAIVGSLMDLYKQYHFDVEPRMCKVLWVDTEQSREHIQKVLFRINLLGMMPYNAHNARLLTQTLREESPTDRLNQLCYAIEYHQPKLVVVDGVSDLMSNTNCLEESEALVSRLLQLSTLYRCHIMCVLHTNPNSDKARGHLGSTLMRKAETVMFVHKVGERSVVEPQYCRNMPFERFAFMVEEIPDATEKGTACVGLGLPVECDLPTEQEGKKNDCVRVLEELGGCASRKLLCVKLRDSLGITDSYSRAKVTRALQKGLIAEDAEGVVSIASA